MCVCYCTKPKAFNEVKRYHCPSLVWYVQKLQKTRWCYFLCLYLLVDCAALDKSFDVSFHVVPGKKPFNSVAKNPECPPTALSCRAEIMCCWMSVWRTRSESSDQVVATADTMVLFSMVGNHLWRRQEECLAFRLQSLQISWSFNYVAV